MFEFWTVGWKKPFADVTRVSQYLVIMLILHFKKNNISYTKILNENKLVINMQITNW